MINFATYPDGIFKGFIKLLFYTVIPIGFVNYIPVRLISNFNIYDFLLVIGVATIIVTLAIIVFNIGLKRYSSSNLMNARV